MEPKERDPLLYNRTYTERLARWRFDSPPNQLMGPSVIDVSGLKNLLAMSGGCCLFFYKIPCCPICYAAPIHPLVSLHSVSHYAHPTHT